MNSFNFTVPIFDHIVLVIVSEATTRKDVVDRVRVYYGREYAELFEKDLGDFKPTPNSSIECREMPICVVCLTPPAKLKMIVHESVHVADAILRNHGIKDVNKEAGAYLTDYIADTITNKLAQYSKNWSSKGNNKKRKSK